MGSRGGRHNYFLFIDKKIKMQRRYFHPKFSQPDTGETGFKPRLTLPGFTVGRKVQEGSDGQGSEKLRRAGRLPLPLPSQEAPMEDPEQGWTNLRAAGSRRSPSKYRLGAGR